MKAIFDATVAERAPTYRLQTNDAALAAVPALLDALGEMVQNAGAYPSDIGEIVIRRVPLGWELETKPTTFEQIFG